ncbi:MAG TPA: hypothetical protein VMW47_07895 [Verrucomicrobiae bacterium]|nr:hypothetical protein [Verrucomicrobiae bacterium]
MTPLRDADAQLGGAGQLRALSLAVREARGVLRRVDRLAAVCEGLDEPAAAARARALRDACEGTLAELIRLHAAAQRRAVAQVRGEA